MIKGEIFLPAGTVEFQCHDLALKMTRFDILRWNSRFQQACVWLTIDAYPHFFGPVGGWVPQKGFPCPTNMLCNPE